MRVGCAGSPLRRCRSQRRFCTRVRPCMPRVQNLRDEAAKDLHTLRRQIVAGHHEFARTLPPLGGEVSITPEVPAGQRESAEANGLVRTARFTGPSMDEPPATGRLRRERFTSKERPAGCHVVPCFCVLCPSMPDMLPQQRGSMAPGHPARVRKAARMCAWGALTARNAGPRTSPHSQGFGGQHDRRLNLRSKTF